MEPKKPNSKYISLGVLVAVVLLVVAVAAINKKDAVAPATANTTSQTQATSTPTETTKAPDMVSESTTATGTTQSTAPASPYTAGTYSADGSYQTPGGEEAIRISLTVSADGTVTDSTAVALGQSRDSKEYQARFISGYKSNVVGKKISSLSLGNISGSSLTPIGFNKAIAIINQKAQA